MGISWPGTTCLGHPMRDPPTNPSVKINKSCMTEILVEAYSLHPLFSPLTPGLGTCPNNIRLTDDTVTVITGRGEKKQGAFPCGLVGSIWLGSSLRHQSVRQFFRILVPHVVLWLTGSVLNTAAQSEYRSGELCQHQQGLRNHKIPHNLALPEPSGKFRTWWHCALCSSSSCSSVFHFRWPPRLPPSLSHQSPAGRSTNHQPTLRRMGFSSSQGLQAQPVAPSRPAWPYRQFSPTLTRRARSVPLSCTK